ncbi:PREDICTED: spermatogenesis-associated protein 22 isoform X2 [Lepidothrix coronata]|uniref:Spermatogenesis-associated protein 22 isoform X2 n=1 Tax=Lepidothrix coronata TaxID=321398 RepID=A0A6J0HTZ5_9PASS|nr:PREDICTED: spermatogenesis-associated protein 22 isoform X2 [Lepidothrix coronata]
MKRSFGDTSTRSTAGCLPVPLFNQKKRTRQPLTSNPIKNEPGAGSGTRTYDFSPTSFGWGTANPEVAELQKAANSGQTGHQMAPSLMKPPNASKFNLANAGKNLAACRNRNEYTLSNTADSRSDGGITRKFGNLSNNWKTVQQQKPPGNRNSSQLLKTETSQTNTAKGQWPVKPNPAPRSLQGHSPAYRFNYNIQQNKMNENQIDFVPEEKSQEVPSSQIKIRDKRNSLRILSAVIESLRHWSQYSYKTALLFEVLGTLDSAVTPGAYGAKNFLLRDGKETLPCVFYEIDRELPRLIRGRVHRCMGNYDAKRNIFKCVSVRPATAPEQNTFQDFVKIADAEMTAYVKTMNEM